MSESNEMKPLPCVCGCGYVACNNARYGWYGACSGLTCGIRTGFCPTADDARKRWDTIQRALLPNAVTIELPELPEGYVWDRKTLMVTMTATREHPIPRCDIDIDAKRIAPTPAEIRERSQTWAAQQPPGTVARYKGVTWFWHQWRRDTFMVAHEDTGSDDPRYSGKTWQTWDDRLDGIGPEHVIYMPSEAGEDE